MVTLCLDFALKIPQKAQYIRAYSLHHSCRVVIPESISHSCLELPAAVSISLGIFVLTVNSVSNLFLPSPLLYDPRYIFLQLHLQMLYVNWFWSLQLISLPPISPGNRVLTAHIAVVMY